VRGVGGRERGGGGARGMGTPPAETTGDPDAIVFACRRRDRDYRIQPVPPDMAADPEVAARLTALLWSGEAA